MKMKSSLCVLLNALVAGTGSYALPALGGNDPLEAATTATPTVRPNKFGFTGEQTATFKVNGPDVTLSPNVHWSFDTKRTDNVIPLRPNKRSQIYYGVGDASKEGQYALTTYNFLHHSVNLDHTVHVSEVSFEDGKLAVKFCLEEAYQYAVDSWDSGLLLIAFTKGCGDYDKGERCYFHASDLSFNAEKQTVVATGEARHPDDITSAGETEWGLWSPDSSSGARTGSSFEWKQTDDDASTLSRRQEPEDQEFVHERKCQRPTESPFGLPTSCLDEFFDQALDDELGYEDMTDAYTRFVDTIEADATAASFSNPEDSRIQRMVRARAIERRGLFGWLRQKTLQVLKQTYQAVKSALSINVSINKDFSWKFPNRQTKAVDPQKLNGTMIKQVESPWGDSILLKSFKPKGPKTKTKTSGDVKQETSTESYMNIYCVGCGVSGSARIGGRARWTIEGFEEGQLDIKADMRIAMKLGIDAQISHKTEFSQDLFNISLPGLSYGVVTIGPRVSVASKVVLEAAANGKLLAGAEMGIENAHARIDFVKKGNNQQSGWKPYFKPTFMASGELAISSSLGFPVSLACGIKAGKWDKSVQLTNEPSIKMAAQISGSFGLNKDGKLAGAWASDLEDESCKGINTVLSWRNQLSADVFGLWEFDLHDTEDQKIKSRCIKFPGGKPPPKVGNKPGEIEPPKPSPRPTKPEGRKPSPTPSSAPPTTASEEAVWSRFPEEWNEFVQTPSWDRQKFTNCKQDKDARGDPAKGHEYLAECAAEQFLPWKEQKDRGAGKVKQQEEDDETERDDENGIDRQGDDDERDDGNGVGRPGDDDERDREGDNGQRPGNGELEVIDDTENIRGGEPNVITYEIQTIEVHEYVEDKPNPIVLNTLRTAGDTAKVISCSNGNVYAVMNEPISSDACSELWAARSRVLVADGAAKMLHYYTATMEKAKVSPLRVSDAHEAPKSSVPVLLAPYQNPENREEEFFVAVDSQEKAYYPLVCDYEDANFGSKVFLAEDPDEGIATLKRQDVEASITGARVKDCFHLVLSPAKGDGQSYTIPDDSPEVKLDSEAPRGS